MGCWVEVKIRIRIEEAVEFLRIYYDQAFGKYKIINFCELLGEQGC